MNAVVPAPYVLVGVALLLAMATFEYATRRGPRGRH